MAERATEPRLSAVYQEAADTWSATGPSELGGGFFIPLPTLDSGLVVESLYSLAPGRAASCGGRCIAACYGSGHEIHPSVGCFGGGSVARSMRPLLPSFLI